MIDINEGFLRSLLQKGIKRATESTTSQLVSMTKRIEEFDPVFVFEQALELKENRTFWKSATEAFYLVTVGNVYPIRVHDESRYETTKHKWEQLRDDAIIHNPYEVEGTGLLMVGGMSFDPKRERSSLWEKYPHSEFVIPTFTLTKNNENHYLTITIMVSHKDHADQLVKKITRDTTTLLAPITELPKGSRLVSKEEIEPNVWKESVARAIEEIKANQAEKIVMARELRVKLNKQAELAVIIQRLMQSQPTSYIFAYERDEDCFVGATPERLVKVKQQELLSTCLAGTAPRGKTQEEDEQYSKELFLDQKNREEHDHVVQMIKQAIGSYCEFLDIPSEPTVLTLKNLQHLYTPVVGELKEEYSVIDVIQKLHPTPALGGAPTKEALAFIRKHELLDRGWFGSPVGWLDHNDHGEFAVAIRSGLIQGDEASLFAGCGVMRDSCVEAEYEETNIKFLPMLTVLEESHDTY